MKWSTLLLLGAPSVLANNLDPLSYGSFSEPALERRQSQQDAAIVITTLLAGINNQTLALNEVLKSFSVATILSLQTYSQGVVNSIYAANKTVAALTTMVNATNGPEVLLLTGNVTTLAQSVNTTVGTTIAQKTAFGGVAPVVLASLQQQLQATTVLTLTINSKLPSSLASISGKLTAPIFQSLYQGIAAFQSPNVNPSSVYAATGSGANNLPAGFAALAGAAMVAAAALLN